MSQEPYTACPKLPQYRLLRGPKRKADNKFLEAQTFPAHCPGILTMVLGVHSSPWPIPVSLGSVGARQRKLAESVVYEERGPKDSQESETVVMDRLKRGGCERTLFSRARFLGSHMGWKVPQACRVPPSPTRPPCLPVTAPDVRSQQTQPGGWMLSPLMGAEQTAA